jgi:hypothetical protein
MVASRLSKDDVARYLAQQHFRYEPELTRIFRVGGSAEAEARPDEPIKLLEVNPITIESGVVPVGFDPSPASGVPYSTVLIEITPKEFQQFEQGLLKLPRGWQVMEEIPRAESPGSAVGSRTNGDR